MTRTAKTVPMPLQDFAPRAAVPVKPSTVEAAPAPTERRFAEAEMEAAVAAARAAGREEAADTAAAAMAVQLAQLGDAFAREAARRSEALEEDRVALRDALRSFLTPLCRRLAAQNAAPLALSLVERMLAASDDRKTPATLFVSEKTFATLAGPLQEAAVRGGIEIGSDAALDDGECRLQWRGGAASYSHDAVTAEIDRLLAAAANDASGERP